jgi:DNA-3-methyladenine glycosylase I
LNPVKQYFYEVKAKRVVEALKKRGFKFVGSTICYAHMQATGMVDDHVLGCFKYKKRSK